MAQVFLYYLENKKEKFEVDIHQCYGKLKATFESMLLNVLNLHRICFKQIVIQARMSFLNHSEC